MTLPHVSIQTEDFDLSHEVAVLRSQNKGVGAICSFVGTVRDRNEGDAVSSMELEHYPGMTEKSIEAIIDKAVVLRENVLVNLSCIISHDSDIGAHSFLSPNVAIAGFVTTGECANLGISTTIIDHVSVGPHVRTGGATVVVENLDKPGLYVGNPARFIR